MIRNRPVKQNLEVLHEKIYSNLSYMFHMFGNLFLFWRLYAV